MPGEFPNHHVARGCEPTQVGVEPLPLSSRVAEGLEECGLEASDRMLPGEKIVAYLRRLDMNVLSHW